MARILPVGKYIACYGVALVPLFGLTTGRPVYEPGDQWEVKGWARVDEDDVPLVCAHRWHWTKGYAHSLTGGWMHRLVLGMSKQRPGKGDLLGDHINRDRLDNRKANLRTTTPSENMRNREHGPRRKREWPIPK